MNVAWVDATTGAQNGNTTTYTATSSTTQSFTPPTNNAVLLVLFPAVSTSGTPSLGFGAMFMESGGSWPSPTSLKAASGTHTNANVEGTGAVNFFGANLFNIAGGYQNPLFSPASNMSFSVHMLTTSSQDGGASYTPASIVAGNMDAACRGWIDDLAAKGLHSSEWLYW